MQLDTNGGGDGFTTIAVLANVDRQTLTAENFDGWQPNIGNAAPVVTMDPSTADYLEGITAATQFRTVANSLTLSDSDDVVLQSATIAITAGLRTDEDLLTFNASPLFHGDIAGSYDAATGILSLASAGGGATLEQWRAAIASVQYSNSSQEPEASTRTFAISVFDGTDTSNVATRQFNIVARNDAPAGTDTTVLLGAGPNHVFSASDFGFTDADGDAFTGVRFSLAPTGGTIFFDADGAGGNAPVQVTAFPTALFTAADIAAGKLSFVPNGGAGAGFIRFRVADDGGNLRSGQDLDQTPNLLIVDFNNVNDAPVVSASFGSATFIEGSNQPAAPAPVDSGLVLTDVDDGALTGATVSIVGGFEAGQDVLSFTNNSPSAFGNISASYSGGVLSLTSAGGIATVSQWQSALRAVGFSTLSEEPSTATRTISFRVNDGALDSNVATRSLNVQQRNDSPSGADATIGIAEDSRYVFKVADFAFSDVDGDALMGVGFAREVTGGSLQYFANGSWIPVTWSAQTTVNFTVAQIAAGEVSFLPTAERNGIGAGSVPFQVFDNGGTTTSSEAFDPSRNWFTFDISAVNDAPTLSATLLGVERLSTGSAGAQANGDSFDVAFSPDGALIAFRSRASNLTAGDANNANDIFVKDLATGQVTLVSADAAGAIGNNFSVTPQFLPGGRVAFVSAASNLVAGDTNNMSDIFIKDLASGAVTRISTGTGGTQLSGFGAGAPAFSADGTRMAFSLSDGARSQVYLKDLASGTLSLASTGDDARAPEFSPDGTKLLYESAATIAGTVQIRVKDLASGTVTLISADALGTAGNGSSQGAHFSPDGTSDRFQQLSVDPGRGRHQRHARHLHQGPGDGRDQPGVGDRVRRSGQQLEPGAALLGRRQPDHLRELRDQFHGRRVQRPGRLRQGPGERDGHPDLGRRRRGGGLRPAGKLRARRPDRLLQQQCEPGQRRHQRQL